MIISYSYITFRNIKEIYMMVFKLTLNNILTGGKLSIVN